MPHVLSTAIEHISHDTEARALTVTFKHGDTYRYSDVSDEIYNAFIGAESKGRFFVDHVRDHYAFELASRRI